MPLLGGWKAFAPVDSASALQKVLHGLVAGKRVYIALVWQNEKGQKGPFSHIEGAFIP
jgi:hypothetical protein